MQSILKIEHIPGKAVYVLGKNGVDELLKRGFSPADIRDVWPLSRLASQHLQSIENNQNNSLTS